MVLSKEYEVFVDGVATVEADSEKEAEKKAIDQDWEEVTVSQSYNATESSMKSGVDGDTGE